MKVAFPNMGNLYISIKVLFDILGIEYVIPSQNKKKLERGLVHSPEFACLPFKLNLEDFMECIERGADTLLVGGGCGQCRFGYYADLHTKILEDIGYRFNTIHLDSSNMTPRELYNTLKPLSGGKSILKIACGILGAAISVLMVDSLFEASRRTRCREIKRGETDRVMKSFQKGIYTTKGFKQTMSLIRKTHRDLKKILLQRSFKPVKVVIVGEIFTTIDPFVNLELEKVLGNMGVQVETRLSISSWIIEHFIKKVLPVKIKNKGHERGKEFFKTDDIGGHGLSTVGNIILSGESGFDGAIHIYPFTCMPEIAAQSAFGEVSEKYGIPIMSIVIDEMTGESGYLTRIEAFVDMLEKRRSTGQGVSQENPAV